MEGGATADEFATLEKHWNDFDFFYMHVKETDLAGEDGDFSRKVNIIESVDSQLPRLTALMPDVIVVCDIEGDFNTNLGPLRFARHGNQIVGCLELDGGDVAFLSGTLTGRLARVSWRVTSEAGRTEGNAVFAISAAAGQLHGVTYRNGKLDDEMTGVRVPASRGPKCVPTPSVQSPTSG